MAILLTLNFLFCSAEPPAVDGWRGIIPLHSTRADVERLLGPGANECKCAYYLDDVNVLFTYSSGDCNRGGAWDVPRETVLKFVVYPKPNPRFSELELDTTLFRESHDGHIEDVVSYVNDGEGLIIEVNKKRDIVLGFYYGPTKKDQHLRCQKSRK